MHSKGEMERGIVMVCNVEQCQSILCWKLLVKLVKDTVDRLYPQTTAMDSQNHQCVCVYVCVCLSVYACVKLTKKWKFDLRLALWRWCVCVCVWSACMFISLCTAELWIQAAPISVRLHPQTFSAYLFFLGVIGWGDTSWGGGRAKKKERVCVCMSV